MLELSVVSIVERRTNYCLYCGVGIVPTSTSRFFIRGVLKLRKVLSTLSRVLAMLICSWVKQLKRVSMRSNKNSEKTFSMFRVLGIAGETDMLRSIDEEVILRWSKVPVLYCPVCGKRIADWASTKPSRIINPCRHLLFVYSWEYGEFGYLRDDVAEKLKQQGVELVKTLTGVKIRGWIGDTIVLLKRALGDTNFAVYTLYTKTPPITLIGVSMGIEFEDFSGATTNMLYRYTNAETLEHLRRLVFGDLPPRDAGEALRRAAEWVSERVHVDKCEGSGTYIKDPVSTIQEGRGSCWDAAVLLAAILLSVGVEPVYVIDFDTPAGKKVVAAAEVNGELYVVDREPRLWHEYFGNVTPLYDLRVFKVQRGNAEHCWIDKDKVAERYSPLYLCR